MRAKAVVAFLVLAALLLILYVPPTAEKTNTAKVAETLLRATDFVEYVFGKGWLSLIWLTSLVVDGVTRWAGTRIWEARDFSKFLDFIVIAGFVGLFISFITGQPIRAFG